MRRDDLVAQAWAALKGATVAISNGIVDKAPPAGAAVGHMGFLHALIQADRPMAPTELAETLAVTPATVTGAITTLERLGLITRTRDEKDRRAVRVAVTAKGRTVQKQWVEMIRGHLRDMLEPLTEAELETVATLLARVAPPIHGPPRGIMTMWRHDVSSPKAKRKA